MRRIAGLDDIAEGLDALERIDPRLTAVRAASGEVPLRLTEPGFVSLARIVTGQQVSTASATAIFGRLTQLLDPLTPQALLRADASVFRQAGLSGPKERALLSIARSVEDGLDLHHLCSLEAEEAMRHLTAVKGIGPWTAEVYLLFAAGHPDIFPAKDVALQAAVGHALGLESRPSDKALAGLAEQWSPWRGVAARLFWAYYRTMKGREGVVAGTMSPKI